MHYIDKNLIKQNIRITDLLISEWIAIKKIWDNYFCRCINPEHPDENPSMSIKDSICYFECYSCKLKGDIFNILDYIKPELYDFKEQIHYLYNNYYNKNNTNLLSLQAEDKTITNIQDNKDYQNIMLYIAKYCVLRLSKEILGEYLINKNTISYTIYRNNVNMKWYWLNKEIIDRFMIGYMPNSKELYNELIEQYDKELVHSIWLFDNRGMPLFKNRIVIPYLIDWIPRYFIARQTEYTPSNEYEQAKYKNQRISNKYLYNEDDLNNACVFIVESAFDCLALKSIWYNSVATWWINLSKHIISKLIEWLKDSTIVYICFDNDRNKAWNNQAKELNNILQESLINSHMITLPLQAWEKKIDINEYLWTHTKEDFNNLLSF